MDTAVWSFYGFRNPPFGPAARRAPFFRTDARNALIRRVAAEIRSGRSVIGLRGEHGIGKSALLADMAVALKAQGCLAIAIDRASQRPYALQDAIHQAREQVAQSAASVTRVVLLFDDAEFMPSDMFRMLSRLLQACTSESLKLHCVLIGGTGLWAGLNAPDLAGLRKAAISENLIPYLEEAEAADYLDRKLQHAGQPLARLMTKRATADLVARAHGLPARLDALAEQALAFSYTRGRRRINSRRLRQALGDVPAPFWLNRRVDEISLAALAMACLGGVGALVAWQHRPAATPYERPGQPAPVGSSPVPAPAIAAKAEQGPEKRGEVNRHVTRAIETPPASVPARPVSASSHTSGLVLLAGPGDDLASLYAKVYRGVTPPPFDAVEAANRAPVTPGTLVIFPAPPGGWPVN